MVEKICPVKHLQDVNIKSDDFEGVWLKELEILDLLNSVSKRKEDATEFASFINKHFLKFRYMNP
jgi:hypothetical protein